jgi:hypothetical protein
MNTLKATIALLSLAMFGCQTAPQSADETNVAVTAPEENATQVAMVTPEESVAPKGIGNVTFLDLSAFDDELSGELSNDKKKVSVNMPANFNLNNIPPRLEKWFSKIVESGGKVQAQQKSDTKTRVILGYLIDVGVKIYDAKEEKKKLAPAQKYNVIMEYDEASGKVSDVVFFHR